METRHKPSRKRRSRPHVAEESRDEQDGAVDSVKKSKTHDAMDMLPTPSVKQEETVTRKTTLLLLHAPSGETHLMIHAAQLQPPLTDVGVLAVSHVASALDNGVFYRACRYPQAQAGEWNEDDSAVCVVVDSNTFRPRLFCVPRHDIPMFLLEKHQGFLCGATDPKDAVNKLGKRLADLKGRSTIQHHPEAYEVVEIFPTDFRSEGIIRLL